LRKIQDLTPLPLEVARVHAELVAAMRQQGLTLGANDAYIAATALAAGRALLTADADDLHRVPGLVVLPLDQPPSPT
jgi:predicted nucleic acid-binding protein